MIFYGYIGGNLSPVIACIEQSKDNSLVSSELLNTSGFLPQAHLTVKSIFHIDENESMYRIEISIRYTRGLFLS